MTRNDRANEIVRALREKASINPHEGLMIMSADLIESLQDDAKRMKGWEEFMEGVNHKQEVLLAKAYEENESLRAELSDAIDEIRRLVCIREKLKVQLAESQRRERAAVECIEDIAYQNRKFSHNWVDVILDEWRGAQEGEAE